MLRLADDCVDATETTNLQSESPNHHGNRSHDHSRDPAGVAPDDEEEEVDVVGDSSVPMVTVTNESVTLTPSGSVCHTPCAPSRTITENSTTEPPGDDETHLQPKPKKEPTAVLIVRCDDRYLKTLPGIIRFLQVVSFAISYIHCLGVIWAESF